VRADGTAAIIDPASEAVKDNSAQQSGAAGAPSGSPALLLEVDGPDAEGDDAGGEVAEDRQAEERGRRERRVGIESPGDDPLLDEGLDRLDHPSWPLASALDPGQVAQPQPAGQKRAAQHVPASGARQACGCTAAPAFRPC
jgi:hypothetical protein